MLILLLDDNISGMTKKKIEFLLRNLMICCIQTNEKCFKSPIHDVRILLGIGPLKKKKRNHSTICVSVCTRR